MGIKNVRVLIICVGVLLSVLTPKATEFLPKKASNTTKIGIEKAIKAGPNNFQTRVRADMRPLNFYEGTNVSTSLKLKFIDLLRKLVPYTQLGSPTFWFLENNVNSRPPTIQTLNNSEEYKRVDSGRDFKDQFLLGRNPDLVSDQEVSSVGHKNYGRWNLPKAYGKMSSDPVNRSGFGYTPHTTNDKRHYPYKSISKPGSYRQQQRKYEEEFGDTNLETLNSFNKYEGNSNTGDDFQIFLILLYIILSVPSCRKWKVPNPEFGFRGNAICWSQPLYCKGSRLR